MTSTNIISDFKAEEIENEEPKIIDEERIIKFYIGSGSYSRCNVDINDTVFYAREQFQNFEPGRPIEHRAVPLKLNNQDNHLPRDKTQNIDTEYNISPRGVYSEDVDIEYFGFSKIIRTFSTYFKFKQPNNTTHSAFSAPSQIALEYIYTARNLIQSFSDFRNDSSYDNLSLNYNLLTWHFKNENYNQQPQKLKIEFYFDLGESFVDEKYNVSIPMQKTVLNKIYNSSDSIHSSDSASVSHSVVKFSNSKEIKLNFNETLQLDFIFPLYFENCKNYNLNFIVVITGFMLIGFLAFVLYRIILIIFEDEKEENFGSNNYNYTSK